MEAAIGVVARVGLELQLVRVDLDQPSAERARHRAGLLLLGFGIRRRARQHRHRAVSQLFERELQQQRRVHAAGESHQDRVEVAHDRARAVQLA